MSFSDFEYAGKRKQTRRERFLAEMEQVVPWSGLVALIEPHCPKAGGGRKPYPLETMLRIDPLQNWFSLNDPAMEGALYEITSMRQFARLTLSAPIPEDTTIMNFRHLLEKHQLAAGILETINITCQARACRCASAPSSTPLSSTHPVRPRTRRQTRS
jgi:IS5 family transposase